MAATGYTPISLYYSTTASAVPTAGNLANGELALNIADMKLYAKNSAGTVTLLASNASTTGVDSLSFGSTGLTPSTATTGAITVAGTLNVANGGTGLTSLTAGYIPFGSGTSAFGSSANLFWDSANARLGIGTSSPTVKLDVAGAISATAQITVNTADGANQIRLQTAGVTKWVNYTQSDSLRWYNTADRMTLDSAGNLGLGVTPSASTLPTIQSTYGVFSGNTNINIINNAYYSGGWKYVGTGLAAQYQQDTGKHIWYTASSGTAGNAITFTQAMTLDASGNLLVGTTTALNTQANRTVLTLGATTDTFLNFGTGATRWGGIYASATKVAHVSDGFLAFETGGAERARITSAGAWSFGSSGTNTGNAGEVLTSQGSGSAPTWVAASSGGVSTAKAYFFSSFN